MELVFVYGFPLLLLVLGFAIGRKVENKHLASLKAREEQYDDILETNLRTIPESWSCEAVTFVDGQVVIASDYFKSFASTLRGFFGGELRSFQSLMCRARREARLRCMEKARAVGANVLWNVRYETSTIGRSLGKRGKGMPMAEIFVYATALKVSNL